MTSRRDQVQAQSYVLGRLNSALVMGDPEAAEPPHRRILVGLLAGALVAALVAGGFAIYGYLRPGGADSWRRPGQLVVEKETGNRYVLIDGTLRPVLNYASAVLLLGEARPPTASVSSESLRSVPVGLPVGIVGAPDALPPAGSLADASWKVCALTGRDSSGNAIPASMLNIEPQQVGPEMDPGHAMVARAPDDRLFLVWRGQRFALTAGWLTRALGYDERSVKVDAGWLDLLPAGSDIGPVSVPRLGEPGPIVDGRNTRIGQVFVARTSGTDPRYYLLQRDGLSRLSVTGATVVLSDPKTARAYDSAPVVAIDLTPAALAGLPASRQPTLPGDLPQVPPLLATEEAGLAWCVRTGPAGEVDVTYEPLPEHMTVVSDGVGITRTARTAVAVSVGPRTGGLIRLGRPGQALGSTYLLVTDAGVAYPFPDAKVAAAMGYPPDTAVTVSPALAALLPTGPTLDPYQIGR